MIIKMGKRYLKKLNRSKCAYCKQKIDPTMRKDARFCCDSHKVLFYRQSKQISVNNIL